MSQQVNRTLSDRDTMPVGAVQGRISSGRYDFNLLVSCGWGEYAEAKREIVRLLVDLGDKQPEVRKTVARGGGHGSENIA
jgi:hypothetical protein